MFRRPDEMATMDPWGPPTDNGLWGGSSPFLPAFAPPVQPPAPVTGPGRAKPPLVGDSLVNEPEPDQLRVDPTLVPPRPAGAGTRDPDLQLEPPIYPGEPPIPGPPLRLDDQPTTQPWPDDHRDPACPDVEDFDPDYPEDENYQCPA
jgi:hypothetical protein